MSTRTLNRFSNWLNLSVTFIANRRSCFLVGDDKRCIERFSIGEVGGVTPVFVPGPFDSLSEL